MFPKGFEWIVILISGVVFGLLPVAALVAFITLVVRRVWKGPRASRQSGGDAAAGDSRDSSAAPGYVAARDDARFGGPDLHPADDAEATSDTGDSRGEDPAGGTGKANDGLRDADRQFSEGSPASASPATSQVLVTALGSASGAAPTSAARAASPILVAALNARVGAALANRGLSDREREVALGVLRDGGSFADLAVKLGVSRSTVGTYCKRAYEKLGATGKDDAFAALARLEREQALLLAGLTEREAEVALLAASGATSADIARELVLSEATADSHLAHIYGKLGVHSRDELAALVASPLKTAAR